VLDGTALPLRADARYAVVHPCSAIPTTTLRLLLAFAIAGATPLGAQNAAPSDTTRVVTTTIYKVDVP
jgi:hypothetical protein